MSDCETLEPIQKTNKKALSLAKDMEKREVKKNDRDDLGNMTTDFFGRINFKIAIFLFIFGVFIFSDMFIEHILSKIKDASSGGESTTKGTLIQLLILVLFYLISDLLVQAEII
jgi:hypothetical protein